MLKLGWIFEQSRDDGDMQMDEIQSRVRNKASKMLGKWVVRSAVHSSRKQADVRAPPS
jgi:hypothetical protein